MRYVDGRPRLKLYLAFNKLRPENATGNTETNVSTSPPAPQINSEGDIQSVQGRSALSNENVSEMTDSATSPKTVAKNSSAAS